MKKRNKAFSKNGYQQLFTDRRIKKVETLPIPIKKVKLEASIEFTFDKFLMVIFCMGLFIFFSTWIEPMLGVVSEYSKNGVLDAVKFLFSAAGGYAMYLLKSSVGKWKFMILGISIILLLPLAAFALSYILVFCKKIYIGKNLVK